MENTAARKRKQVPEGYLIIGVDPHKKRHALFAAVVLGTIAYFIATHVRKRRRRILSLAGLLLLMVSIGVSRVYLGAHWPSDVIGGYLVGTALLATLIWFYERWKDHLRARESGGDG